MGKGQGSFSPPFKNIYLLPQIFSIPETGPPNSSEVFSPFTARITLEAA